MDKKLLTLLSAIPLAIGFGLEFLMNNYNFYGIGINLIGVALLLVSYFIGRYSLNKAEDTVASIFFGNFLGIISLTIILLNLIIKGQYPSGVLGRIAQTYFLPIVGVAARLDVMNLFKSVTSIICLGFILMIIAYYLGIRKKINDL
jgi:hypothetical protein